MELQRVDVLELVDEQVAVLPVLDRGEVAVVADRASALDEHVVEVDERALALDPLVALVDRGDDRRRQRRPAARLVARAGVRRGIDHPCLGPFDLGRDVGGLHELTGAAALAGLADERGEDAGLAVEQRWRRDPGVGPPLPELRERDRVEGARVGMAPQAERAEPGPELARRLAGERDDEDVAGIGGPRGEAVRDAAREHSGLAGAGAGDDAERRARARDRGALRFVEVGQQVHRGHLREGVGHCRWPLIAIPRACGERRWGKRS